jgi:hypothetical protein
MQKGRSDNPWQQCTDCLPSLLRLQICMIVVVKVMRGEGGGVEQGWEGIGGRRSNKSRHQRVEVVIYWIIKHLLAFQ